MKKRFLSLILLFCCMSSVILAQSKAINLNGTWHYSQKDFKATVDRASSEQTSFKNVTFVMSNAVDSIKYVKAETAIKINADNKWSFGSGEVSTFNKFGDKKTVKFDKLDVIAIPEKGDSNSN